MNDITLTLENVGKFKNADITFAGITLLTGNLEFDEILTAVDLHALEPGTTELLHESGRVVGDYDKTACVTLSEGSHKQSVKATSKRNSDWEGIATSNGYKPFFADDFKTSTWYDDKGFYIQGHDCFTDASLIICEQPEVAFEPGMIYHYVYPVKQLELVDQIVNMYNRLKDKGTRVVVTSNSDYILMGLRIAIKKQQLAPEDVSIVYLYKDKDTGIGAMRIKTSPNGELECWPEGFYDTYEKCLMELF